MEDNTKRQLGLIIIAIIILSIIVFLVYFFCVPVEYSATEEYLEKEPYTYKETYTEQVPYTRQDCHNEEILIKVEYHNNRATCIQTDCATKTSYCIEKNIWGNCVKYGESCTTTKCIKYRYDCGVKITNKDQKAALVELSLGKYDYDEEEYKEIKTENIWVRGLDEGYAYWDFNYIPTETVGCHSTFNHPTKSVCENVIDYKADVKTRDKTGYKDVVKTRAVTKYATLYKQWTGQVEWYIMVQQ